MKLKIFGAAIALMVLFLANPCYSSASVILMSNPPPAPVTTQNPLSLISARQFVNLTPQKFRELTGKKMTFLQRLQFRVLQHKVKKMLHNGEVVSMADVQKKYEDLSTMNVLGLLLGLVLGPVGVVIALLFKETGDVGPDVVRWSLYGLLIWLAIVLVIIIL